MLMVLVLIMVSNFSFSADAYATLSHRLDKDDMLVYYVHQDFSSSTFSHTNEALYKCSVASGYNMMKRHPTTRYSWTDLNKDSSRDDTSFVYRIGVEVSGYIAINRNRSLGSHVIESDINFNADKKFANSAQPDCFDIWSIFLHETGHTVGLDDLNDNNAPADTPVMYGNWGYRKNTIYYRNLRPDDIAGAKSLYR